MGGWVHVFVYWQNNRSTKCKYSKIRRTLFWIREQISRGTWGTTIFNGWFTFIFIPMFFSLMTERNNSAICFTDQQLQKTIWATFLGMWYCAGGLFLWELLNSAFWFFPFKLLFSVSNLVGWLSPPPHLQILAFWTLYLAHCVLRGQSANNSKYPHLAVGCRGWHHSHHKSNPSQRAFMHAA